MRFLGVAETLWGFFSRHVFESRWNLLDTLQHIRPLKLRSSIRQLVLFRGRLLLCNIISGPASQICDMALPSRSGGSYSYRNIAAARVSPINVLLAKVLIAGHDMVV